MRNLREFFKIERKENNSDQLTIKELLSIFENFNIPIHPALKGDDLEKTIDKIKQKIASFEVKENMEILLTLDFQCGIRIYRDSLDGNTLKIGTYNAFLDADRGIIRGQEAKRIKAVGKVLSKKKLIIE